MPTIPASQRLAHDTLPTLINPFATHPSHLNSSTGTNSTNNSAELSSAAFAGLAVLIALLALFVGALQLRVEYRKRREAQDLQDELIELEAEISERIRGRLRLREQARLASWRRFHWMGVRRDPEE